MRRLLQIVKQWLGYPSVQIALCTLCYALLAYKTDRWTVLFAAPGYAAAIARPIINLVANMQYKVRASVWLPVHGEYYAFKDTPIQVWEDEQHWRWIALRDVETALAQKFNLRLLQHAFPDKVQKSGRPARWLIRDDALLAQLSRSHKPNVMRFRTWLERNVVFPSEKLRQSKTPIVGNGQGRVV